MVMWSCYRTYSYFDKSESSLSSKTSIFSDFLAVKVMLKVEFNDGLNRSGVTFLRSPNKHRLRNSFYIRPNGAQRTFPSQKAGS